MYDDNPQGNCTCYSLTYGTLAPIKRSDCVYFDSINMSFDNENDLSMIYRGDLRNISAKTATLIKRL